MDDDRIAYFRDRYSRMSDEELTNLLINRHQGLSNEANAALTQVLERKNPVEFMREVDAKVQELNDQAHAASLAAKHQAENNRRARRSLKIFAIATALIIGVVSFIHSL